MRLLSLLALAACGVPAAAPCTVADHDDGTATITCPDGSSATVGTPDDTEPADDTEPRDDTEPPVDPDDGCGPVPVVFGDVVVCTNVDLALLRCVTRITGSLTIVNTQVPDLADLNDLTEIGGALEIRTDAALTSLDGLASLARVGGNVSVEGNPALVRAALDALAFGGGNLDLKRNAALETLSFASLVDLTARLEIDETDSLTSIDGLGALTTVGGALVLIGNDRLESLDGLGGVTTVVGPLELRNNDALPTLGGLSRLTTLGSEVLITGHDALTELGLDAVESGEGAIRVQDNPVLCDSAITAFAESLGTSCTGCGGNATGC
jgi:hypothetical protein